MEELTTSHDGSELHRLKPMQENYDEVLFNKLHKISKPVIRKLARQIDCNRFKVTPDIIESYFWDKMLYIFNKYYGSCSEEHLTARILRGLATFKNHLLHSAYTERAEFNQSLHSFEDLYEDSNEDKEAVPFDIVDEKGPDTQAILDMVHAYMRSKLFPDAWLVYEAMYCQPPFIKDYPGYKEGARVTNVMLMEFFDLEKNTASERYIKDLRADVEYWLGKVKEDIKF